MDSNAYKALIDWAELIRKQETGEREDYYVEIPGVGVFKNLRFKPNTIDEPSDPLNMSFIYDDFTKNE